jgi:hypothetical protein
MPRAILYFKEVDKFLTWSTIVDAPVTCLLTEEEYRKYYICEYGRAGMEGLDEKIEQAKKTGCNWGDDIDDVISGNRAGDNESDISKEEIIERYTDKEADNAKKT